MKLRELLEKHGKSKIITKDDLASGVKLFKVYRWKYVRRLRCLVSAEDIVEEEAHEELYC